MLLILQSLFLTVRLHINRGLRCFALNLDIYKIRTLMKKVLDNLLRNNVFSIFLDMIGWLRWHVIGQQNSLVHGLLLVK